MKKIIYYSLLILNLIFIFSCEYEKTIKYDMSYQGDRIVVHALLNENGIKAYVNKTVSPNAVEDDNTLENVSVALYENDVFLFFLEEEYNDFYISPKSFKPSFEKYYQIKIKAENLPEAYSSKQYLLNSVSLDTAYYSIQENNESIYRLIYSFKDPINISNYYSGRFYSFANGKNADSATYKEFINPYEVFNDNNFNGDNKIINKELFKTVQLQDGLDYPVDSVQIVLFSLSDDLYLFLSSIVNYETTQEDPWYEQPDVVYSNITDGFGIFASFATDTIMLKIDNF